MPRSQSLRPPVTHPRAFSLRVAWRIQGILEWLAQQATPQSWWNGRTVPGKIVVATNSALGCRLIDEFLAARPKGGLFGVKSYERVAHARRAESKDEQTSLVAGAWT